MVELRSTVHLHGPVMLSEVGSSNGRSCAVEASLPAPQLPPSSSQQATAALQCNFLQIDKTPISEHNLSRVLGCPVLSCCQT
jgi:hypothetical protein